MMEFGRNSLRLPMEIGGTDDQSAKLVVCNATPLKFNPFGCIQVKFCKNSVRLTFQSE